MPTLPPYEARVLADGAGIFWRLHEAAGANAVDDIGSYNYDTTPGDVTFGYDNNGVPGSPGTLAKGISTVNGSGLGPYVSTTSLPGTNFTEELWVRPTSTTSLPAQASSGTSGIDSGIHYVVMTQHGGASGAGLGIAVGTNGVVVTGHGDGFYAPVLVWSGAISSTVYSHIVLRVVANVPYLYVNGALAATGVAPSGRTAYGSSYVGTGSYGTYTGYFGLYALYPTALSAQTIADHYTLGISPAVYATPEASLYDNDDELGAGAYGGSSLITSPSTGRGVLSAVASGASTVTFGMSIIPRAGDIVLIPVTAGDQPTDIILEPQQGPDTLSAGSEGRATVTMGQGERYTVRASPAGVAVVSSNTGVRYRTLATSNGQAGTTSLNGLFTNSWYLGSPWHVDSMSVGRAGCTKNEITVYSGAVFTSRVFVYPSTTPPDVNLAPETGPGATKSMVSTNQGIGHMTATIGGLHRLVTQSDGRATARNIFGATGSWYLGSPFHIDSTSAGAGGARDAFFATGKWYMGSPFHVTSTSAGVAGARDQFFATGKWYLGSPFHITSTSNGQGGCPRNYVSGAIFLTVAFHGYGGARDQFGTPGRWYLGSSTRMAATSAGRANVVQYLSTPVPISTAFSGRGGGSIYLGSPFHVFSTAAGKGGGIIYMGSRVYMSGTSSGRSVNSFYLGSPFHVTMTSAGRGFMGGNLGAGVFPVTYMRGVAHWELGPRLIYAFPMVGVGHMNDIRTTGTQRQNATSNGVGGMRENSILLRMVINGSSRYTEFDKPPFAFVCNAGCNAYGEPAQAIDSGIVYYDRYYNRPTGVFATMAAPIRFGNHDYNIEGRGNASMAGRSTFSFPYEMVAICNAGCRAFDSYRADDDPRIFPANGSSRTPGGVFAHQFSPDYIYSRTNSQTAYGSYTGGAAVFAYMSSRVYYDWRSNGRSTAFFLRINEADFHGVGGGNITLGVDHRNFGETISNGRGGWPVNYLPDRRALRMFPHGVAGGSATQAGKVHFEAGDVTSHGIGNFFIDPGLLYATSNGVGHMNDITRPTGVFMQWGSGEFYYTRHFPVIAPLLIPNGSNGMSEFICEINGVAIIHHHMNGVGKMTDDIGGIAKGMSNQVSAAGCYRWVQAPVDPDHPGQESHSPWFGYLPSGWTDHKQGVEIAFTPVEVVWQPNGIGHIRPSLRIDYALVWDSGQNEYYDVAREMYLPTGAHPSVFQLSGSGGKGHMYAAGPRRISSVAYARARDIFDMSGRFSNVPPIHGIATAILYDIGGGIAFAEYGNMLAIHFSRPQPPAYGQFWPRRFRYGTVPV